MTRRKQPEHQPIVARLTSWRALAVATVLWWLVQSSSPPAH